MVLAPAFAMRFLSSFATFSTLVFGSASALAQGEWEDARDPTADPTLDAEASVVDSPAADPSAPAVAAPRASSSTPGTPQPAPPATQGEAKAEADTGIVLKTEEPPPLEKTSRRVHDGLYIRTSLGQGWFTAKFTEGLLDDATVGGRGGAIDLQLGGTPASGLVVGGGLFLDGMDHHDLRPFGVSADEYDGSGTVGLVALGPFVDYFPDPKRGLHFGGTLVLAALAFHAPNEAGVEPYKSEARRGTGGGLGAWVGHDWWVEREFSLGVQLRYLGAAVRNEPYEWRGAADTLTLEFTGLFH